MRSAIWISGVASSVLMLSSALMAADEDMLQEDALSEENITTFEGLDTDGDHYLSRQEAEVRDDLKANWKHIDIDQNNQLDISEFSAFEGEGRFTPPEESEIPEPGAAPYSPGRRY